MAHGLLRSISDQAAVQRDTKKDAAHARKEHAAPAKRTRGPPPAPGSNLQGGTRSRRRAMDRESSMQFVSLDFFLSVCCLVGEILRCLGEFQVLALQCFF